MSNPILTKEIPLLSEVNVETLQDLSASLDSCFHLFFRTKE